MGKTKNVEAWVEEGYKLFAEEGLEGIQVERLARILGLNKSGFYHHFGDLEGFCTELLMMHEKKVGLFLQRVEETKILDPDYLNLLIEHAVMVMFQVQLTRDKRSHSFYHAGGVVDQRLNLAVRQLWSAYLDVQNDSDLAMRYFNMVRDMFYTRISFKNLNYEYLHDMATEAKRIVDEIGKPKTLRNA
jgi:AcrR family transcriptional regulator